MNKFCCNCETPLELGAKFCTSCGAKAAVRPLAVDAKLSAVPSDSLPTGHRPTAEKGVTLTKTDAAAAEVFPGLNGVSVVVAPARAGETVFDTTLLLTVDDIPPDLGPLKVLLSEGVSLINGIGRNFKNKKKLIPALILSGLWLLLMLLPALGINFFIMQVLSWLTFAHGGTGDGILSLIGGIFGKGVFAGFVFSLFSDNGASQGLGRGLKNLFSFFTTKGSSSIGMLLGGAGLALIAYNFMAGSTSLANVMVGVASLLLSLRALGNRAGFMRRFLGSFTRRPGNGLLGIATDIPLAGLATGFTLSLLLSAFPFAFSGYILGVLLLIASTLLRFLGAGKAEEGRAMVP